MDRPYVVSGGLYRDWDRSHEGPGNRRSPVADTGIDLAHAIIRNPDMKVLVQQGFRQGQLGILGYRVCRLGLYHGLEER